MDKTERGLMRELYQAVVGIPESPTDNGLIGDIQEIKSLLILQNGRVKKLEVFKAKIIGVSAGIGLLAVISGVVLGVIQLC